MSINSSLKFFAITLTTLVILTVLIIPELNRKFIMNNTSQHILGTSADLLGFCMIVITSFQVSSKANTSYIDEFVSIVALVLTISCFYSFLSIRSTDPDKTIKLETTAETLFMLSLVGILSTVILIGLNILK